MTWILYVLFMSDTREMQFVIEKRFFLTEQKCMRYYQNNSRYLDKKTLEIIQKEAYEKYFSFYDLEKLLSPNDYRLCSIHLSNNNIFEGNVFCTDNLYISKKFLSRI